MSNKQPISKEELIKIANSALKDHEQFIKGIVVTDVIQTPETLLFMGESFLDGNGLPTLQSTTAFNLYKWLSHQFSGKYQLVSH